MQSNALHSLHWLLKSVKNQRRYLLWAGFFTLVKVLAGLAIVLSIYTVIEFITHLQMKPQHIVFWVAVIMVLIFLRYCCVCLSAWLSHKAAFSMVADVKIALAERLLHLPVSFFSKHRSTDIRQVMEDDANRIEAFIAHHITDLATALLTPLLASILLFFIYWPLAVLALLPLPIAFAAQVVMFRNYGGKAAQYHQVLVDMNQRSAELVRNIACLRLLQGAKLGVENLKTSVERYVKAIDEWTHQASWAYAFLKVALDFSFILLLPAALYFYFFGSLTMEKMIVSMMLGLTLMQPFYNLLMFSGILNQILEGVKRIQAIENEPILQYGHRAWPDRPAIQCEQVTFRFQPQAQAILSDINLHISYGEKIAIVGESGSGKSTLLQLLAGFYMPQVGRVKYGGRALFDCRRQQVYQHIAYAMQDNTIFHDSIKNNITMGDKGISDEQVWQVLSLVKADTFVAQKPGQLAFVFEGQHSRLSGGEQQRLGIARVLIKPAQCYFFDEATRFFDPKMEGEVIDNIMHGLSEKTVIFVTHRIENIHFADRVIVLSKGCVVGFDNHENLLKNCEVYQALQNQHLNNSLRKATNHHKGNWRYA